MINDVAVDAHLTAKLFAFYMYVNEFISFPSHGWFGLRHLRVRT